MTGMLTPVGGAGDMTLAGAQTVTGSKTFTPEQYFGTIRNPGTGGGSVKQVFTQYELDILRDDGYPILLANSGAIFVYGPGYLWRSDYTGPFNVANTWHMKGCNNSVGAGATADVGMKYSKPGFWQITDGGSGGGVIEWYQVADVATPSTNCAAVGAEDVAGTAELIASDEAGNETQLTEHRGDGPDWLYDDIATTGGLLDRIEYDRNRYLGRHRYINLSRERRLRRAGIAETTEPGLPTTCEFAESFEEFAKRTGVVKAKRDWEADQDAKRDEYLAKRSQTLDLFEDLARRHVEAIDKVAVEQAKIDAAYEALPDDLKALTVKATISEPVLPPLPEVPDIDGFERKAKPEWLASFEAAQVAVAVPVAPAAPVNEVKNG